MRGHKKNFIFVNVLAVVVVVLLLLPGDKKVKSPAAMLAAMALMECIYLYQCLKKKNVVVASDIMTVVWVFLGVWEMTVSKLDLMHPVLVPAPENVFHVFRSEYVTLLSGVWSSMRLLFASVAIGLGMGLVLGVVVGWQQRLRNMLYPIASVLAPIPSVVFAPYLIAIMPTFRSASALVILLGIFWPTFLNMILRVQSMDSEIVDSARALHVTGKDMIFHILLPYLFPGIIERLKMTLTTSVTLLTFAEMMGATSGMGYFITNYNHYGNYTNVVAGIIVVGIVVTILNYLVGVAQGRLIRWRI